MQQSLDFWEYQHQLQLSIITLWIEVIAEKLPINSKLDNKLGRKRSNVKPLDNLAYKESVKGFWEMIQLDSQYSSGLVYGSIVCNYLEYPENNKGDKKDNEDFVGN